MSNVSLKSKNQLMVEQFMLTSIAKFGEKQNKQDVPILPVIPSLEIRKLRARLILEEAIETIKALGFSVKVTPGFIIDRFDFIDQYVPELEHIADGVADIEVVTLGTASACGLAIQPIFEAVCDNNMDKYGPGCTIDNGGKIIKPPNHKKVDIITLLKQQGWSGING